MRVQFVAALAYVLVVGSAWANDEALDRARALYRQLDDAAQCESGLPAAREFWRSSAFETLEDEIQSAFLSGVMGCAWSLRDWQGAIAAARDARSRGAPWPNYALLQLGIIARNDALTVESFDALALSDAKTLSMMPMRFAWGATNAAARLDPTDAAALRIHNTLETHQYADPDGIPDDALRIDHARLLVAVGHIERARRRLESVVEPRQIMILRIDRRFDALRGDASFERRLDIVAAAHASLARARAAMAAEPRKLVLVLDVAQALRILGENADALALLNRHIEAARAADGASRYDDIGEQINWLLNEKGYALYDLARPEEARNAFSAAIAAGEGGQWNVSQTINFASMLAGEGRAADALEVIRTVGQASPYGDMWAAAVRVCAGQQLEQRETVEEALGFMRAHIDDNVAAMTRAYLCANDLDAAAALYIRRLENSAWRESALVALQSYRWTGTQTLPQNAILIDRVNQVRARADVQAAINAVGRIEESPLHAIYWGDV
jgi:tetratricopeptide (TPR) repeat protein